MLSPILVLIAAKRRIRYTIYKFYPRFKWRKRKDIVIAGASSCLLYGLPFGTKPVRAVASGRKPAGSRNPRPSVDLDTQTAHQGCSKPLPTAVRRLQLAPLALALASDYNRALLSAQFRLAAAVEVEIRPHVIFSS